MLVDKKQESTNIYNILPNMSSKIRIGKRLKINMPNINSVTIGDRIINEFPII